MQKPGGKFPKCDAAECAAYEKGRSIALIDNDFGERKCPFFKTKEQAAKEKQQCEKRLAEIGTRKQEG